MNACLGEEGKNREHIFKTRAGSVYKLDFFVPKLNKIIEFDGEYWHNMHVISDGSNKTREQRRDMEILDTDPNLQIFHIKERDYIKNKEGVLQECLNFLNAN